MNRYYQPVAKRLFVAIVVAISFSACTTQRVTICCEPHNAAIYVNGMYQGKGLVEYCIPRGSKHIVVSCSEDGVSFANRTFPTHGISPYINIYMSEYMRYSSSPAKTLITH